jgi:hypothetical protein
MRRSGIPMSSDPWKGIDKASGDTANGRRVNETLKWDLYWARDKDGRCLLLMRFAPAAMPMERLPKLRGIDAVVHDDTKAGKGILALTLTEASLRDVFHKLCLDIISCVSLASTEKEAVTTAVARTWRWHHLLRGGAADVLSREEQKGLIGELLVLETYFLPVIHAGKAVEAWKGPSGGAKDFVMGSFAVESKACNSASMEVTITSVAQLDASTAPFVYLHVTALDPSNEDGFTVSEVVNRVRALLSGSDPAVSYHFEARLAAAGYRDEDDYSQSRWRGGERAIFSVTDSFPRLTPATVPAGITRVVYDLDLGQCSAFLIAPAELKEAIRGAANES